MVENVVEPLTFREARFLQEAEQDTDRNSIIACCCPNDARFVGVVDDDEDRRIVVFSYNFV